MDREIVSPSADPSPYEAHIVAVIYTRELEIKTFKHTQNGWLLDGKLLCREKIKKIIPSC